MAIEQALEASGGSTADAARTLGISQRKIQYRLKEWDEAERAASVQAESD